MVPSFIVVPAILVSRYNFSILNTGKKHTVRAMECLPLVSPLTPMIPIIIVFVVEKCMQTETVIYLIYCTSIIPLSISQGQIIDNPIQMIPISIVWSARLDFRCNLFNSSISEECILLTSMVPTIIVSFVKELTLKNTPIKDI